MTRSTIGRVHGAAAVVATLLAVSHWITSAGVELLGGPAEIAAAKRMLLWSYLVLLPALAVMGMTGMRLGGKATTGIAARKKRRLPFMVAIGMLILVPSGFTLDHLASTGELGGLFYAVQAAELVFGAVNITLLAMSMRDGFAITGRFRKRPPARDPNAPTPARP